MKIKPTLLLFLLSLSLSAFAQMPQEELFYPGEEPELIEEPMAEPDENYPQRQEDLNYHVPSENPDEEYFDPEMMDDPGVDYQN